MSGVTTPILLEKGDKMSLTKGSTVTNFVFAAGWDIAGANKSAYDLDIMAFPCNAQGKRISSGNDSFVFYGNKNFANGAIEHSGDNLTGAGDGDDESLFINLDKMPAEVTSVNMLINIYQGSQRNQNFGKVENAFVRVYDKATGEEKCRFNLSDNFTTETNVEVGTLYKTDMGEWNFKAVGTGNNNDTQHYLDATQP